MIVPDGAGLPEAGFQLESGEIWTQTSRHPLEPVVLKNVLAPDLERELKQLKAQLPDLDKDTERFPTWWKAFGGAWTEELRAVMIQHRHIGHDWRFSKKQQDKLRQYYDTNKLLVDCLNSDCYVSRAVRDKISETLLLPLKEPVREAINQWLELAANVI